MTKKSEPEGCPICGDHEEELGRCQHGTRMCVQCWHWFNAPCCGGEDWDGKELNKDD